MTIQFLQPSLLFSEDKIMPDNTSKFSNFFDLFEIPVGFDIDDALLGKKLRQLQSQYHPDKQASDKLDSNNLTNESLTHDFEKSNATNEISTDINKSTDVASSNTISSEKNSAVINHAYNVLKNPDSRANYLLELSGQQLNTDDSIADIEFLDDAMDLRMRLDVAEQTSDLDKIKSLKSDVEQRTFSQSQRFKTAYNAQDWSAAMDATQKLKFLVKLRKDMDIAIDNSQQFDNDDDLYL